MHERYPRQVPSDLLSPLPGSGPTTTPTTDPQTSETESSSIPTSSPTSSPATSQPPDSTSSSLPPSTSTSQTTSSATPSSSDDSSLSSTTTQENQTSTLTPNPTQSQEQSETQTLTVFQPTYRVDSTSVSSTSESTTSFTTIVTSVNGQLVTTVSPLPTSLAADRSIHDSTSSRAGIIAGATIGGVVVLLLVGLALLFAYRRNKLRKFLEELTNKKREREGLLADEGFDDDEHHHHHRQGTSVGSSGSMQMMYKHSPSPTPLSATHPYPSFAGNAQFSAGSAPSLFPARPRASESGSLFHEDGVWPPPGNATGPFMDPFVGHIKKRSEEVNLEKAVDDVMGKWGGYTPSRQQTGGSASTETPSLYSTSNTANEYDVGLNSIGSTPSPPTHRSPTSSTSTGKLNPSALPPGAAPSMKPGLRDINTSTPSATPYNSHRRWSSPLSKTLDDGAHVQRS